MTFATVDIDLYDIDTQDMVEHLERVGYIVYDESEHESEVQRASPFIGEMHDLYELKVLGKEAEFEEAFRQLCYKSIGRIL